MEDEHKNNSIIFSGLDYKNELWRNGSQPKVSNARLNDSKTKSIALYL